MRLCSQFYVLPKYRALASQIFASILKQESASESPVHGAFVSTAEPDFMTLCLDQFERFQVNAITYQLDPGREVDRSTPTTTLQLVTDAQLEDAVAFAVASIGANAEWLRSIRA